MYDDMKKRLPSVSRTLRKIDPGKLLKIIILILAVFIVLEIVYHFVLSDELILRNVYVQSDADLNLSRTQIMAKAGLTGTESYFSFDSDLAEVKLTALPEVKTAIVKKDFPNKINIHLVVRKPVVVQMVRTEKLGSVLVGYDSEGILCKIGSDDLLEGGLPLISGPSFDREHPMKIGAALEDSIIPYIGQLEAMTNEYPELLSYVSEFYLIKKNGKLSEVLIYPVKTKIKVRTRAAISARLLKNTMLVLDTIDKFGITEKIEEVDLRTDEPVYREREG